MAAKYTPLGVWAKSKLMELGMESRELAEQMGVSEQYLSDIFTGRTKGLKHIDSMIGILTKKDQMLREVV